MDKEKLLELEGVSEDTIKEFQDAKGDDDDEGG